MRVCVSASVKRCVCVCGVANIFLRWASMRIPTHVREPLSFRSLSLSPSSSHLPTKHMGCTENNCRNRERAAQWEQTFEIKKKVRKEANKTPECEKKTTAAQIWQSLLVSKGKWGGGEPEAYLADAHFQLHEAHSRRQSRTDSRKQNARNLRTTCVVCVRV